MNAQQENLNQERLLQEEVIDLRQYIRIVDRFKWRIAALAVAVAMLTAMVVFAMTPRYQATATLMIEAEQAKALSIEEVYGLDSTRKEYFLTQFEILKSRRIARRVVERLDLASHPLFDPAQQEPSFKEQVKSWLPFLAQPEMLSEEEQRELELEEVTTAVSENLTISPVRNTQLVKITFESESPELAAKVANTVAEVFIESHLEAKMEVTQQATSWLNERLEGLRIKLENSEAKLQAFQEAENLVDVEGVQGLAAQELNQITEQLTDVRRERKQAESIYQLVQERGTDIVALANLPEVLNHQVIQNVKQAETEASRKVSELAQRYGPKHPKMIAARDELAAVRNSLRGEVRQLIAGIENDYRTAQANERALEQELAEAKRDYQKVSRKETRYNELKREVDVNRQLYNAFLTRFKETSETSDFEAANARLTDPAIAPRHPAKPKKKLIVALAFVVAAMFGVMLAFLVEALNDGIRNPDDVENKLRQRMIGLLPWVERDQDERLSLGTFFDRDQHQFAEAVRTLRTSLVLSHLEKPAKVISVTSSVPGEGKTTVAENLGFALAQMEKVLLVDADMRRPSVGKDFGLPVYHPGLSNLIAGSNELAECIHHDEKSGMDVMPAGAVPPNPQELLSSPRFAKALQVLADKYDRVILDTAPAQVVSDALVVSRVADSMLYVVKADSTREKMINTGIGRLLQVGAKLDGVVLNQVDTSSKASYYGDYYGYEGEYAYSATPAPADAVAAGKPVSKSDSNKEKDDLEVA
ncbi:GumC family protein [Microbulbifer yueqingensis]|uniref:non-specific protein-tyrosine kinase n=1 Tax=Microbulbifer yueqingensis TaxID=658219 RepID=A0A1G8VMX1_9GAMM|nr:polysaccharide biosynthesis tyrosine autokinase [Microbulbifer yueqingensis]SDJ66540.1 exopolysaccharide transport protein family [Microbulbifer yueqingensis]